MQKKIGRTEKKIKYVPPLVISLSDAQVAVGARCNTGASATNACQTGSIAVTSCGAGGRAGSACAAGTAPFS